MSSSCLHSVIFTIIAHGETVAAQGHTLIVAQLLCSLNFPAALTPVSSRITCPTSPRNSSAPTAFRATCSPSLLTRAQPGLLTLERPPRSSLLRCLMHSLRLSWQWKVPCGRWGSTSLFLPTCGVQVAGHTLSNVTQTALHPPRQLSHQSWRQILSRHGRGQGLGRKHPTSPCQGFWSSFLVCFGHTVTCMGSCRGP